MRAQRYNYSVMVGGDPMQPGHLSPDGMWRWDGQQWVPTAAAVSPPAPPRSLAWVPWLVGGCAVLALIAVVAVGFGVAAALKNFQASGLDAFSCLPSDFPNYPGATISREYRNFGANVAPGDTRSCQMTFQSNDDLTAVTEFYVSRLAADDWTITSYDQAGGEIRFRRNSRPATVGVIDLLGRGQRSQIEIRLDS